MPKKSALKSPADFFNKAISKAPYLTVPEAGTVLGSRMRSASLSPFSPLALLFAQGLAGWA